ncbi:hypothetical protein BC939DRAFT_475328 [Gamsiella multidivaricata]|uniref:uncharacterized protein n=1 Tax=Gamsiella multidivaricata TaxID=101098 RepID=UPI00221FC9C2|nr:uncharacterized protein BC939DRAFT_475328 [Gamsiella multidivaricata]KAG0366579.1 hypothetical protein BGZ54_005161 [Gamsiella multidivaricata]KAI7827440.1 hypothetical protein BC939DRAFT_475328 [Gamsiella multidivaricata]
MPLSHQSHSKPTNRPSVSSISLDSSSISSLTYADDLQGLKPLPQAHAPLACVDPSLAVPFDMSILTISHKRNHNTVKAVVVGGGIAGLAIAIMMDLAGMEFDILERSTGNEPTMSSAIALGPPALRLLEQMDLLPQIERHSKIVAGLTIIDGECRRLERVEGIDGERYGYPIRVMSREALHKIFLDRVPKSHLHRGKLVVETLQNPNGVSCKCSDGSTYYGDIIIGADGAQSLTRERMYVQLREQGKLPEADMEASYYGHVTITGISDPLDKSIYPIAHDKESELQIMYTKDAPYTLWYVPIADNRVAWGLNHSSAPKYKQHAYSRPYITPELRDSQELIAAASSSRPFPTVPAFTKPQLKAPSLLSSKSSPKMHDDWYVPASIDLEKDFSDLLDKRCALGAGTVRDFVARTPKKAISMIDNEERLYKTWYSGRIVLIGDACHEHLVIGGQSVVQGILDGVCLVNLLYDMEFNGPSEFSKAFKKYQSTRISVAKSSVEQTNMIDKIFQSQGFKAGMVRKFMFGIVGSFNLKNDKLNNNRPQLSFLPFVEDYGSSKANRQKISARLSGSKTFTI